MALFQRKPRPLKRESGTLRDTKLFIVACDDTYAPAQYFGFFKHHRVQVHVVPTKDNRSTAQCVLDRLLNFKCEEDDQLWLLLDTDHCLKGSHNRGFAQALTRARKASVHIALSRPCFELWLLLHHVEIDALSAVANASDAELLLRQVLGEYNKTKLKAEHFPAESVLRACQRAEELDQTVAGGDKPESNTSRVYLLWREILNSTPTTLLPDALQE